MIIKFLKSIHKYRLFLRLEVRWMYLMDFASRTMNGGGRWGMKSIGRRITDALGLTRPTTTFIEEFSFDFYKSSRHVELTNKQILLLEQMIDNYNQQNISICKCDVERVLDSCDLISEELPVEG